MLSRVLRAGKSEPPHEASGGTEGGEEGDADTRIEAGACRDAALAVRGARLPWFPPPVCDATVYLRLSVNRRIVCRPVHTLVFHRRMCTHSHRGVSIQMFAQFKKGRKERGMLTRRRPTSAATTGRDESR